MALHRTDREGAEERLKEARSIFCRLGASPAIASVEEQLRTLNGGGETSPGI